MKFVGTILVAAAAFAVGGLAGHEWHRKLGLDPDRKIEFVETSAAVAGQVDTVVLGDSVTEETWLDGACGRTFNAGIGGARVRHVSEVAARILPELKPKTIVIAVGANHFWVRPEPEFEQDYPKMLDQLPPARLVLVGVPNSRSASAFVRKQAASRGAIYVPPVVGEGLNLPDRVHLTVAGARLYRARLEAACLGR